MILKDIGFTQKIPTIIFEDNQGAICLSKHPKDHSRTKHIDVKFHYVREGIKNKQIELRYCPTGDMVADSLTKGLPTPSFEKFRSEMGVFKSLLE